MPIFVYTVVQNRISAFWFEGKELAFAFGCTLAFSRLGSVLNFLLTENFNEQYGLQLTLWGGGRFEEKRKENADKWH